MMESSKQKIEKITNSDIALVNIASLSDRPNSSARYGIGNLNAQALKERFDAFPKLVQERLNAIIDALSSSDAAKYITLNGSIGGVDNLYDFLALFCDKVAGKKNISDYISALYTKLNESEPTSNTLQQIVDDMVAHFLSIQTKIDEATEISKEYADVKAKAAEDAAKKHADVQKKTVVGSADDTENSITVYGARAYASHEASAAKVSAIAGAKEYTDKLVSAGWIREVVTNLPTPESAKPNVVYMIKRSEGLDANDVYDEYFLITVNGVPKLELMGNTELDLSQYTPIGKSGDDYDSKTYYGLSNRIYELEEKIGEGVAGGDLNGDYDFIVTSEADFDHCLYKLFVDEDTLTDSEATTAFALGSASLGVPDENFKHEKVLVKGVTFTKQRGFSAVRMHIFQPSIKYIRFENCRWEESWYVSGAVPTTVKNAGEFNIAPNLTLTVSGVHITEDNVNSLPSGSNWNIEFKNIKRATDCSIDYPAGYNFTKAYLVRLTFQYFSFIDSCKVTTLVDGTNISNCIISYQIVRCKNCVNVMRDTNVLHDPFALSCDGVSNFSGDFSYSNIHRNTNVAATEEDVAVVKEDIAAVEGRISSVESRVTGIEQYLGGDNFIVDDSIAYTKVVPKNACGKAKILTVGGMTYESENLIPNLYGEDSKETTVKNGITFEKDGRGRVIVKGTATIGTYYTLLNYGTGQDKSLAKNAILTGCPSGGSNNTYRLWCSSSDGSSRGDSGKGCEMVAGLLFKDIYIYIGAGYTANNLVFEPKLRYLPLLENDIKVTAIDSIGENIIPFPYTDAEKTENGVTFTPNNDGSIKISGTPTDTTYFTLFYDAHNLIQGFYSVQGLGHLQNYALELKVDRLDSRISLETFEYTDGANSVANYHSVIAGSYTTVTCFNGQGLKIRLKISTGSGLIDSTVYPQLIRKEFFVKGAPFKQYVKRTIEIPEAVQTLPGYGQGISNSWYNYIDFNTKQFIRNVNEIIFNGQFFESWSVVGEYLVDSWHSPLYDSSQKLISDSTYECTFVNGSIAFKAAHAYTVESWKSYLSSNPIHVLAKLNSPVVKYISDILLNDGLIEVNKNGTIIAVNEHNYPVPSSVKYLVTYPKEV